MDKVRGEGNLSREQRAGSKGAGGEWDGQHNLLYMYAMGRWYGGMGNGEMGDGPTNRTKRDCRPTVSSIPG